MLTLTTTAVEKVKEFLVQHGRPQAGLRVRVVGGGCSGYQYQLALDDEASTDDAVYDASGVRVFVDAKSSLYLNGTVIDYIEDIMAPVSGSTTPRPRALAVAESLSRFSLHLVHLAP